MGFLPPDAQEMCAISNACKHSRRIWRVPLLPKDVLNKYYQSKIPMAKSAKKDALITVQGLRMHFPVTEGIVFQRQIGAVKAVDDIRFEIRRGETLGLVGESGCGKTTVGRCLLRLENPSSGSIMFENQAMENLSPGEMRQLRKKMQVIFQDPYSSLNPRMSIGSIISEGALVHKICDNQAQALERSKELLALCGLPSQMYTRFPHELSGGQRQRVGIARALSVNPQFIICDEAVSALDVSIQAQIINLLERLQEQFNLTYLFIAHDLSVVRHISNRTAVMYLGKIMELNTSSDLYHHPLHPYTQALLEAVPIPDPEREATRKSSILQGEVPSPLNPPTGCVFHPRCALATDTCRQQIPEFINAEKDHWVACHHYDSTQNRKNAAAVST